jgi:hypothetical protein
MDGRKPADVAAAPAAGTISINNINNTPTSFLNRKPVRRR